MPGPPQQAVTDQQIVSDALKYEGHPYVYGVWDCSGFANHVLGQDLGLVLPGGLKGYRGPPPHGPVVIDYVNWSGAGAVPFGSQQPGDLVLWPGVGTSGHMGFVLGANEMISALDPQQGTARTPIQGFGPSSHFVFRRVHGMLYTGAAVPGTGNAVQAVAQRLMLLGLLGGAAVLAAVALAGLAAAAVAGITWGTSRAG